MTDETIHLLLRQSPISFPEYIEPDLHNFELLVKLLSYRTLARMKALIVKEILERSDHATS